MRILLTNIMLISPSELMHYFHTDFVNCSPPSTSTRFRRQMMFHYHQPCWNKRLKFMKNLQLTQIITQFALVSIASRTKVIHWTELCKKR